MATIFFSSGKSPTAMLVQTKQFVILGSSALGVEQKNSKS